MKTKYVLENGFRRLQAFKKLGYTKIPAIVDDGRYIIDADTSDIEVVDNTRLTEDDNMTELMLSIKSVGLLQPIKLVSTVGSEKEFLIKNLIENLQRRDLTPLELGMGIEKLKKQGLNNSEIAIRLGRSKSQIDTISGMLGNVPNDLKSEIGFRYDKRRTGKISVTTANYIMGRYIPDNEKHKLLAVVKSKELSTRQINMIISFVKTGMTVDKALKLQDEYVCKELNLIVNKNQLSKLGFKLRGNDSLQDFVAKALKKHYPLLFY